MRVFMNQNLKNTLSAEKKWDNRNCYAMNQSTKKVNRQ